MEFNVNNIGKMIGTGEVSKTQSVKGNETINSVFVNGDRNKYVPNTPFSGEEQHILGIFACPIDLIALSISFCTVLAKADITILSSAMSASFLQASKSI